MLEIKSKNHINILNLISKYEIRFQLANNKSDWRLQPYIESIIQMIDDEENKTGKLNDELIAAKKKAHFFKGLLEAQLKNSLVEQYTAISLLSPSVVARNGNSNKISETKMIHSKKMSDYENEMKKELLSKKADNIENKLHSEKNFGDIIKYHQLLQEHVTKEMVELVKNLKHNATVSNEIVKKDNELLDQTNQFAETTYSNLRTNTNKIREFASRACDYWLWIMLFLVTFTFLFMVVFIRLFPKKSSIIYITQNNDMKSEL